VITLKQAIQLHDLIDKRCEAEREDEMKGSKLPHEAYVIEQELRFAKIALEIAIRQITKDAP
jgi:hypothetical protein